MLQRLYVDNFRCLQKLEFKPDSNSSVLLIGKNGTGKSTIRHALRTLKHIVQGYARPELFFGTESHSEGPMRFEIDALLGDHFFAYTLALKWSPKTHDLHITEESLSKDNSFIFQRQHETVSIPPDPTDPEIASFNINPQLAAVAALQHRSESKDFDAFREWLGGMVLLAPIPQLMKSYTTHHTSALEEDASNIVEWLSSLLLQYPSAGESITRHLREVFPDFDRFNLLNIGRSDHFLQVKFKAQGKNLSLPLDALSEGEKCFFLSALVLAANEFDKPLFVFWDEPANYLSLSEISYFIMTLRRGFGQRGQIVMASHNDEAVRRFSRDNIWVLGRKDHLAPTVIRPLEELPPTVDLVQSLILGELEP